MKNSSKLLDLKCVPCPLNVVKFKLELEKLSSNQVLIVDLDKGEPEVMIKKTLKQIGLRYQTIEDKENTIKLKILNEY